MGELTEHLGRMVYRVYRFIGFNVFVWLYGVCTNLWGVDRVYRVYAISRAYGLYRVYGVMGLLGL